MGKNFTLSPEQLDIVYLNEKEDIYVQAFAGSGKTTVLREFAAERPFSSMLYLVFNRHNRFSAKKTFPANVAVHTVNSFIYKNLGLKKVENELSVSLIKKALGVEIETAFEIRSAFESMMADPAFVTPYESEIEALYSMMKKKEIPPTQSAALNIFLDNSKERIEGYDYILVDEAQDMNPAFLRVIENFKAKKIFVGDPFQSIYGFRSSLNLFERIPYGALVKTLSKSFRFGDGYAKKIDALCRKMYGKTLNVRGCKEKRTDIVSSLSTPYVHIFRTNASILEEAFFMSKEGAKISVPLNLDEIKELVFEIFYLKSGLLHKVHRLKEFGSYERCKVVARHDKDIAMGIRIVDKFGANVFDMFEKIRNGHCNPKFADIVYLTAHKSKGLEFENVAVGNDFCPDTEDVQEKNLYYMAATRAKEKILFER